MRMGVSSAGFGEGEGEGNDIANGMDRRSVEDLCTGGLILESL